MGADTKASIDSSIAYHQGRIAKYQASLANSSDKNYKAHVRSCIADEKAKIANLRARRKSCKN